MKKYEKIISKVKEESPLLKLIESGMNPEEIKEAVIESLEPYFDNKDILEQFAIETLVPESINLLKCQKDNWFSIMFKKCLVTCRSAKSRDPQSCLESFALWQPQIFQSLSKYWSSLYLEVDKRNLGIEEFLHESLGNIGNIIEGLTKPYLKALLHQIMIANGIETVLGDIDPLNLGTIVDRLIQRSGYADLFMPPPWNIRLNQWRNIAYHHNARIENSEIICWYGETPNITEIRLSRTELLQAVQTTFDVYRAIRLAHTIFFIDNLKEINRFSPTVEVRDDAAFLNFATGLASQGFEIVEFKKNADESKLVVKDVSDLNPNQRRFHASQLLFLLWLHTESKQVIIEYREKDNIPNLLISTTSTICEKIYKQELKPLDLAKMMGIVDLKTGRVVPTMKNN
jgi:hypothetical protein